MTDGKARAAEPSLFQAVRDIMALVAGLGSTRLRLVLYDYLDPAPRVIISRTA